MADVGFVTFGDVIRLVVETVERELPSGSTAWVGHVDCDRSALRIIAAVGPLPLEAGMEGPLESSFCHQVATGLGSTLSADVAADPVYGALPTAALFRIGSFAGVPLTPAGGKAVGTLCAVHPDRGALGERELALLTTFAALLSRDLDAQRRGADLEQVVEQLRREASTDALTGVANRRALPTALATAWRRRRDAAVAIVDVDDFKSINDQFGHATGDAVLIGVAKAMRGAAGRRDTVGRLGGDEFAVVLRGTDPVAWQADTEARLGELSRRLGIRIALSVGHAALADADSPEDALAVADAQLYDVKRAADAVAA